VQSDVSTTMSFRINFKTREADIRKLELISQTDGYLQILRMNADWAALLESRARLAEAVSSIGIEGTVVSLDQAKAITVGEKDIVIGERERREFVGYYESLEYIKNHLTDSLTIGLLLKVHEMVTRGDSDACPGKIRDDRRAVKSRGKIIYTAPPPAQLNILLREFVEWFNRTANNKDFSPVIAAAICHFWFVWIHPFCDGNGRVGRLLTTFLLLKKKSEGIRYFALSDYYNKNKDSYYDALETTNKCIPNIPSMNFQDDLSPWVAYFVDSYLVQMKDLKEVTNRIFQLNIRVEHLRKAGLITDTHNKVLSFLSSRERASYAELQIYLKVTKARVNQVLKPLREAHILVQEKIGPLIWFKLGSPEVETDETVLAKPVKKRLNRKEANQSKVKIRAIKGQKVLPIFE